MKILVSGRRIKLSLHLTQWCTSWFALINLHHRIIMVCDFRRATEYWPIRWWVVNYYHYRVDGRHSPFLSMIRYKIHNGNITVATTYHPFSGSSINRICRTRGIDTNNWSVFNQIDRLYWDTRDQKYEPGKGCKNHKHRDIDESGKWWFIGKEVRGQQTILETVNQKPAQEIWYFHIYLGFTY